MNNLISLLWLIITIFIYMINKYIYSRLKFWWSMPMISTPIIIIILISIFHQSLNIYILDSKLLLWMLGPATISFAIPIYQNRKLIYKYYGIILIGVITGIIVSLITTILLSRLFNLNHDVKNSLITHSISTPFAFIIAPKIGGEAGLAGFFVIITGIFGMIIGKFILSLLNIKSKFTIGVSFGASSHAIGTIKAMEIGKKEGVISSLVMIFTGIILIIIHPLIFYLV